MSFRCDDRTAQCLVYSFREGLLAAVGHDLCLRVGRFSVEISDGDVISAELDATSLRVTGEVAPGDVPKIERNAADDVLAAHRHPTIVFRSTRVVRDGERARVEGSLTLHGVTRPLVFDAVADAANWRAEVRLDQRDFGIKPFSAMLGALRVRPDVLVRISIPKGMIARRLSLALSVVILLVATAAVTERVGAHAIADAPNHGIPASALVRPGGQWIEVGPPRALLAVAVVEPKLPPRATIFVLHGIRDRKENLRHWAEHLAEAGYRAILVDSRGHGASSGDWLTYGVQESRDLSQLVDKLKLDGPIGVMGISYGGATAIEWAAREPRVKAAIAVAPFASLRDIVPVYAPRELPLVGWLVPRFLLARGVDRAGRLGSFAPDEASPRDAAHATHTPILLVHGTKDTTVPYRQSEMIVAGATDHVTLLPLDGQEHDHISGDPRLWPPALDFLGRVYP